MADERRLWTVAEAAKHLDVHEETVRRRIARGDIPAFKTGTGRGEWQIDADALERQIEADRVEAERRARLVGVVSGYYADGDEGDQAFTDDVRRKHGKETATATADLPARRALLEEVHRALLRTGLAAEFADLDEEAAIEVEARALADAVRRAERVRERAEWMLADEGDDADEEDAP